MSFFKRFLAMLLVLLTVVSMVPFQVMATDVETTSTEVTEPASTEATKPTEPVEPETEDNSEEPNNATHNCKYYMVFVPQKDPTCTTEGFKEHWACSYCDNMYTDANCTRQIYTFSSAYKIAKIDHDYESEVVEPKCNAQGYTLHTCKVCGYTMKDNYVSRYSTCVHLTHFPAVAPTCTEAGNVSYYVCNDCSKMYTDETASKRYWDEEDLIVPATGHTHEPVVTPATCIAQGYTTYTCHCGDTYVADYTDPSPYCNLQAVPEKLPTCIETGNIAYYRCVDCETMYYDYIGGHKIEDIWSVVLFTTPHRYTEVEIIPPTCQEGGYTIRSCGDCGLTEKTDYVPVNGKCTVEKIAKKAATCSEYGTKLHYKCTTCGALYSNSKATKRITDPATLNINMTKHTMGSWTVRVPATETTEGQQFRKCTKCDYEETKTIACVTFKLGAPKVTVKLSADGKPSLSWKSVKSAKTYLIYRTGDGEENVLIGSTTKKTYVDTTAKAGQWYTYTVMPINTKNYGTMSEPVGITCACTAPITLTIDHVAETGKPVISWDAADDAASYLIYIGTKSKGPFDIFAVEGTSYTHDWAITGKTYYYKLQVISKTEGANSAVSKAFKGVCACAKPTGVSASSPSAGSIQVTWNAVEGAKKYEIYRASSKNGPYVKAGTSKTTSFTDKKMTPMALTYYKVVALVSASTTASVKSEAASATATTKAPFIWTQHGVTQNSVTLEWDSVPNISGYYVYRRAAYGEWQRIATVKATKKDSVSYVDKKADGQMEYAVTAYVKVGKKTYESPKSQLAYVSTLTAPTIKVDRTNDSNVEARITVTPVDGASGYEIFVSTDGKKTWKYLTTLFNGDLSYVYNIDHGIWHYYKAIPFYEKGNHYCAGPESDTKSWMIYYKPNVKVWMSDSAKSNASLALISVTNKGVGTIRFYSSGARWLDHEYSTFDRNCFLFDEDELTKNNRIVKLDYVDVPKGTTKDVWVMVSGSKTWYDKRTRIRMTAWYDGKYYTTYCSSYYGFSYYLQ